MDPGECVCVCGGGGVKHCSLVLNGLSCADLTAGGSDLLWIRGNVCVCMEGLPALFSGAKLADLC